MQITLQDQSRLYLKLVCLFLFGAYITLAGRDYLAFYLAASPNRKAIEKAIALEPSNAEYEWDLGSFFLGLQRPDLAIQHYRSAVRLNPYVPEYWVDLAHAFASIGAGNQQEEALTQALKDDPRTPRIMWEVANGFLSRGNLNQAFKLFRILLETDPSHVQTILQLCWYTSNTDLDKMMSDVLPRKPEVYLTFLQLVIAEQRTDAAKKIWAELIGLQQTFDPQVAMPYVDYMIEHGAASDAQDAWKDLGKINPTFRPYLPSSSNLIVNGGFEQVPFNAGFDWRYSDSPNFTLDMQQFHRGARSLSISFDGQAPVDLGISQYVAVAPNTRYRFGTFVKSDNIFTAQGPQFEIIDADRHTSLLITNEISGTLDWTNVAGSFETGPDTQLVRLKIIRPRGSGPITGKLWIDDILLARE